MPTQVQCPNPQCGRSASVPEDKLGRVARCKHCGIRFTLAPSREGSPPPAAGPLAAGAAPAVIGRYQVRAKLGSGAFGTVYRAYDPQLDRDVALKVLRPEAFTSRQAVERFQREARAAARMHHPHIVPVYDAGQHGEHAYIASAFISGCTLATAIPDGGLDPRRAARLTVQLAEALAYAHKQGVLHRDVKPGNILLDDQDTLYLTDFGLAGWTQPGNSRLTKLGAVLGTPAYMAPEQASGDLKVGPAADLYSAGVVLYEMVTGRVPFEGPLEAIVHQLLHAPLTPPSRYRPGLDSRLEAICLKALARKPEERYASGQELAAALQGWLLTQEPLPQLAGNLATAVAAAGNADRERAHPASSSPGGGQETLVQPPVGEPPDPTILWADVGTGSSPGGATGGRRHKQRGRWLLPAGAVLVLGIGLAALLFVSPLGRRLQPPAAAEPRKPADGPVGQKTEPEAEDVGEYDYTGQKVKGVKFDKFDSSLKLNGGSNVEGEYQRAGGALEISVHGGSTLTIRGKCNKVVIDNVSMQSHVDLRRLKIGAGGVVIRNMDHISDLYTGDCQGKIVIRAIRLLAVLHYRKGTTIEGRDNATVGGKLVEED